MLLAAPFAIVPWHSSGRADVMARLEVRPSRLQVRRDPTPHDELVDSRRLARLTAFEGYYQRRNGAPGAVRPANVRRGDGAHHRRRGQVAGSARDQAGEGAERRLPRDPAAPPAGAPGRAVAAGAAPRRGDARAEAGRQSPRSKGGRTSPAAAAGKAAAATRGAGRVVAGRGAALARGLAPAGVAGRDVPARALRAGLLLGRTAKTQVPVDRGE